MLRLILVLSLILGASAMAKDGSVRAPKNGPTIDEAEEFFKTEMGRDIDRLFEEYKSGKKDYDQAYDEFNAKWADKLEKDTAQRSPAQVPNAPYTPIR